MRCDSHVHIVGPPDRHPQVAERTYLADVAALETLRRLGAPHGIGRFVIVQPSFYGIDNSATLEALDALTGQGRGVAVIDPARTSPDALSDMARRGVRGVRINLYSPMAANKRLTDNFATTADVAKRMGWHIQVVAPLPVLLQNEVLLHQSPVPIVIDHFGLYGKAKPDTAEGRRLLELVARPHVWMKLSGPYRLDDGPLSTRPDREWVAAILKIAPERCVWGSDWPHPPAAELHTGADTIVAYRVLSYAKLVEDFLAALPPGDWADRIMRDNPAQLYGF